jgi:hypothetical protein
MSPMNVVGSWKVTLVAPMARLQWVMDVKKPMRIKVTCEVVVAGDMRSKANGPCQHRPTDNL